MSICAITTGDQDCKAVLNFLRQDIVLDVNGGDVCLIDIVIEVIEGSLNYFDVYLPYKITGYENRTQHILEEIREGQYHNKCNIKSRDFEKLQSDIIILSNQPIKNQEVSIEQPQIILELIEFSKIKINFKEAVPAGEQRAVRVLFYAEGINREIIEDKYKIYLRYYSCGDLGILDIKDVIDIQNMHINLILPCGAYFVKTKPELEEVKELNEKCDQKLIDYLYYERTKMIILTLPRKMGKIVQSMKNNKPVISYGDTFQIVFFYKP